MRLALSSHAYVFSYNILMT